ncbi:glycoside hydrolase family 16 protein [Rariglobus hedericola]|uniref:Glycoside hydrolase family 16 protein n=1 Tax=Rariglobus hedericola TaxID=2597822 RepID=A0A556QJV1_9BACT|nr:glycoside hydrolase family 16 protein [Rariglobus hedericola]TSJ76935.1 glycoside hydrolase family 16 protein [Rariglobus hedericola]
MKRFTSFRPFCAALLTLAATLSATAASDLFTPTAASIATIKTEKDPVLSLEGSALKVSFPNGGDYPGLDLPLAGGTANLSAFAGVQAEITNTGPSRLNVNLRADNPGDWRKQPWNTNNVWIAAGETKIVKVTFGQSYGRAGYALDAARVSNLKLFVEKPKADAVILVKNIAPFGTGTPAVAPAATTSTSPAATSAAVPAGAVIFTPTAANIASIKTEQAPALAFDASSGAPALKLTFPNGGDYPGFDYPLTGGQLNLTGFAGVQATVTNAGQSRVNVALRAGNPGDWRQNPWNTGNVWIAPGETKTLKVTFGQSYGKTGYALDSSRVNVLKLYVEKPKADAALLISNLAPFGTASATASVETASATPVAAGQDATFSPSIGGELLDLAKNKLAGFNHSDSSAVIEAGKVKVTFEAGSNYPNIQFPIPKGGWNLSAFSAIEVSVTNANDKKVTVFLRADNPGDWKAEPWNTENTVFNPGETKILKLTFGQQNGAPAFPLNPARISAIQIFIVRPKTATTLVLDNLKASGSPSDAANKLSFTKPEDRNTPAVLPAWLGQRPPADLPGEWVKTLDENFDGTQLNEKLWTPRFPWDGPQPGQLQHYVPENVTVANGVATFKVEKKFGHENNDPKLGTRAYSSGLIQSYNKWSQLYGYFEARIKVPYVRGLWPAYWMMPDRGAASGLDTWRRRDTGKGAMEIDIMEILSEWGPGRNSVATHWDGYGSDHKQWGTSQIYYGPTPDGYHVFGLLWEPGKLTWYVDGKKTAEQINDRVSNVPAYLKFNVQMGGWATKNVDDANLPAVMDVDYTRAWQLKSRL